jgi:hypothetical protein
MMAAHSEQGRRWPWHAVVQMVLFEEQKKEGSEEEGESKRANGTCLRA